MTEGFFGSLGNGFAAASDHEIRNLLSQVDATVPPRTQGRTRVHRERYCLVHYLRTLERSELLRYPFKLTKGEKPDFRIEMGSQQWGLEVTEAGSPEHQRVTTELEKSPRGSLLEGGAPGLTT